VWKIGFENRFTFDRWICEILRSPPAGNFSCLNRAILLLW
jgi:hypothetical protein